MRSSLVASLCTLALLGAFGCDRIKSLGQQEPSAKPIATGGSIGTPTGAGATPAVVDPYKVGDRIQVSWQGSCYPAKILKVAKPGVYFITYEGYDHSWDETITKSRICGAK